MSLLVDMMADTLDQGYAERAARTERSRPAPRPRRRQRLAPLLGVLAVGILTGTVVAEVRDRSEADRGLRGGLADEVSQRTRASDALARRAADLRDEVAAVRAQTLGAVAAGRAVEERLAALGTASATTAVQGPGVVVTLDDAPAGDPVGDDPLRGGTVLEGRVRDADLQDVVNGLWAAGAEAVAVDGQRLTALSAIRSAGASVLVDLRPLSPPYVVEAVGDPARLEVRFVDGPSGRRLATLGSLYGIRSEVVRADELELAAAGTPDLRAATPAPAQPGVPVAPAGAEVPARSGGTS
jgi:uncharacterized protein YlxW (UPF0749 family)